MTTCAISSETFLSRTFSPSNGSCGPQKPEDSVDGPELKPDMVIRDAIRPILDGGSPGLVVEDGKVIGVVDRTGVLSVIAAQEEGDA